MRAPRRGAQEYLAGLAQLHRMATPEERRGLWRQGFATLAALAGERQPVPLEGLPPEDLLASVRVALETGLLADLHWLSRPAAAAAVFELAAALPQSPEKRELGRRVLKELHEGDAATFVALATSLALSSRRGLGDPLRARVALCLQLPMGAGVPVDALALALLSRRDLEREWLGQPATGSLPSRRLAARLLERAAREAARRIGMGDDAGVRIFEQPSVRTAFARLLGDRESLVWRHVATARGLLSRAIGDFREEIERGLSPKLGPTEWRRAGASLAASLAIDPAGALKRSLAMLSGEIPRRDPGVPATMIFGLPRVAETEPESAEALLGTLVRKGGLDAVEALVDLRTERVGERFGLMVAARARHDLGRLLEGTPADADDGRVALIEALRDDLHGDGDGETAITLRERVARALDAFAAGGAQAALAPVDEAITAAEAALDWIERAPAGRSEDRRRSFRAVRELDLALLETSTLADLVQVTSRDSRSYAALFIRLGAWLLAAEAEPIREGEAVPHLTLRLRRVRALLHLIDADGPAADEASSARDRRQRAVRVLLDRVEGEAGSSPLRRIVCAALSRGLDALVRGDVWELSDAWVATNLLPSDLDVVAEASMVPELEAMMFAYAEAVRVGLEARLGEAGDAQIGACLDALLAFAQSFPRGSSPRVEAVRGALLALTFALESFAQARSRAELQHGEESTILREVGDALDGLARLVAGARRRIGTPVDTDGPLVGAALRLVEVALHRSSSRGDEGLAAAGEDAAVTFADELPSGIAEPAAALVRRLASLPAEPDEAMALPGSGPVLVSRERPLAPWLPPGRTLGGFYVLRPIGNGGGGSVFVACRVEERHDPDAERFALKVPEYDGTAARTLSEEEFLQLFREEAGALLAVPAHPNVARFVTFDAGARPKPILVMELVEGPTLERLVEKEALTTPDALASLDGVAAGLGIMHRAGVGHLDLKPANVIVRGEGEAVLVDFGLAGRKLRPGCGSPHYGAPEIWKGQGADHLRPAQADAYAFTCLAWEVLTGKTLFAGDSPVEVIASHLIHDGWPAPLVELRRRGGPLGPLAEVLSAGLRQEPARRAPIAELQAGLAGLVSALAERPWPVG